MNQIRRFFIAELAGEVGSSLVAPSDLVHYARDVLRLADGAEVELFDGRGGVARAKWASEAPHLTLLGHRTESESPWKIHVAVPVIKGPRHDWLIEKLTELGVHRWIPLLCDRAQSHDLSAAKLARYGRLIEAAARQAKRNHLLQIAPPCRLDELENDPEAHAVVALVPGATHSLLAAVEHSLKKVVHLTLLVGPEGGFSESEQRVLAGGQALLCSFGPTILRTETAAIAAAAVARAQIDALSSMRD